VTQRRDLAVVAMQGDSGKPRRALVVQSNLFGALPTVTLLPLVNSQFVSAITRVDIALSEANGLRVASQIVVHRPTTISRDKIGNVIGRADDQTMATVTRALAVFLALA
jgi:mRNA interferase MazF